MKFSVDPNSCWTENTASKGRRKRGPNSNATDIKSTLVISYAAHDSLHYREGLQTSSSMANSVHALDHRSRQTQQRIPLVQEEPEDKVYLLQIWVIPSSVVLK
jgi:hypothetical protein